MIETFTVKNYRIFEDLAIEHFGKVNLITGMNNCGKSALLEAIRIFATKASLDVLMEILASREELGDISDFSDTAGFIGIKEKYNFVFRHFFRGRTLPSLEENGITLQSQDDNLEIMVEAYKYKDVQSLNEFEGKSLRRVKLSNIGNDLPEIDFFITATSIDNHWSIVKFDASGTRIRLHQPVPFEESYDRNRISVHAVPAKNLREGLLTQLWDNISLTDLKDEFISGLRIIEERVRDVNFLGKSEGQNRRVPFVRLAGEKEPLALQSMGDGLTRLCHIMLALINAKDGILLIDEFENGLHWSVQPKFWEVIFQLAESLNVQVFATTHSRDCIKSFLEAWNKQPEEASASLIRLDNISGKIIPTSYPRDVLASAIEMEVEVR